MGIKLYRKYLISNFKNKIMTTVIKIILTIVGFIILLFVNLTFKGGIIYILCGLGYIGFVLAIWKYKKKSESDKKE